MAATSLDRRGERCERVERALRLRAAPAACAAARGERLLGGSVQRRQRAQCAARGLAAGSRDVVHGRRVLVAQRRKRSASLPSPVPSSPARARARDRAPTWPRSRCRPRTPATSSADSRSRIDLAVGVDARRARRAPRRSARPGACRRRAARRAQHAAGVAEARYAGFVQQVRVDARDLRRGVGAQAEEPPGQRIDRLERDEVEVAAAAGQQRVEELDERRLHEPVAASTEVIEQRAAQRLHARGLRGQHVLDGFGQDPLTHAA